MGRGKTKKEVVKMVKETKTWWVTDITDGFLAEHKQTGWSCEVVRIKSEVDVFTEPVNGLIRIAKGNAGIETIEVYRIYKTAGYQEEAGWVVGYRDYYINYTAKKFKKPSRKELYELFQLIED